jgi:serine/threonine-protein kinase HipA
VADALAVWLYGIRVALIEQKQGKLRLFYTDDALNGFPLGSPLLSLSLPLSSNRYPNAVVRAFLDGLLPEEEPRRVAAEGLDLPTSDTYGLIRALGRDCAGAIVIQPESEPPPPQPTTSKARPLDEGEIADLVANLKSAPLGIGGRVRISLAGVQEKLLLTRMPDGAWGQPVDGAPSTHILKPEHAEFPNTVANEAFCMRFARHLGLQIAHVETTELAGRRLLVVERYDRIVHPDGEVERVHQEDFCQATGIPPQKKYEDQGGPSLRRIASILQSSAETNSGETLLRAVVVNVLIGNGDAHAKNFSLLHEPMGALRLAPLYDLLSTLIYRIDHLAMYIDNVRRTDRVTADRIVNEAVRWGMPMGRASQIVADMLDRAQAAAQAARDETDGLPAELLEVLDSQLLQVRSGFEAAG